jgi:toxin CptA
MSNAVVSQQPVKSSLRFALSLLALHMMATAVVCVTALPWPAKFVMLMLIILSLAYYLARDVLLLLQDSWRYISLDGKDMSVVTSRGTIITGHVANSTFVSPYFVILCVKPEGQRLPVSRVIFPDAISTRAFREVCVHLRFAK